MATNYPGALDTGTTLPNPTTGSATNNPSHAGLHGNENAAIIATQTKVGTGATAPASNTLLVGTGAGTSAWQTLTSANLISIMTDETGTGSLVFATTPTLVTPKVDTINESTPSNGVTVGGVNLKSSTINTSSAVTTASIAANAVTTAKLAATAVNSTVVDWTTAGNIWYQELGRTTLGVAGATITISSFTARKYLKIYGWLPDNGSAIIGSMTFNNDSGANYAMTNSTAGAADGGLASQNSLIVAVDSAATPRYFEVEIVNVAAKEKLMIGHTLSQGTVGAANAPIRREVNGKWSNTSTQITRVDVVGGANFGVGAEVVVLGHD